MTRTYSQMHCTDTYSQHSSIIWPLWPSDWVFVYELSGCGFESSCSHLMTLYFSISDWRETTLTSRNNCKNPKTYLSLTKLHLVGSNHKNEVKRSSQIGDNVTKAKSKQKQYLYLTLFDEIIKSFALMQNTYKRVWIGIAEFFITFFFCSFSQNQKLP